MIKTPSSLQDLSKSLYDKAKAEPNWRFWGLYVHVCKMETLQEAYQMAKKNGWKRWSRQWLHRVLGLFDGYRTRYYYGALPKVAPAR